MRFNFSASSAYLHRYKQRVQAKFVQSPLYSLELTLLQITMYNNTTPFKTAMAGNRFNRSIPLILDLAPWGFIMLLNGGYSKGPIRGGGVSREWDNSRIYGTSEYGNCCS